MTELPKGSALDAAIARIHTENAPILLADFDENDPNPIETLREARQKGFGMAGQSMIEPVLADALYSLRAYMRLQALREENPWAKIVTEGITDADVALFRKNTYGAHEDVGVDNVARAAVEEASKFVIKGVLPSLSHNIIFQMLRGGRRTTFGRQ